MQPIESKSMCRPLDLEEHPDLPDEDEWETFAERYQRRWMQMMKYFNVGPAIRVKPMAYDDIRVTKTFRTDKHGSADS